MSSERKRKTDREEHGELPALAVGAASLGVDYGTGLVLGGVFLTGFNLIVDLRQKWAKRKLEKIFQQFVGEWATLRELATEDVPTEIDRLVNQGREKVNDRIVEMFHQFAEAKSEAAFPYIARLTVPLIYGAGKDSDNCFRRIASLLGRCEDGDIEMLKLLFSETRKVLNGRPCQSFGWHSSGEMLKITVSISKEGNGEQTVSLGAGGRSRFYELAELLSQSRLGWFHSAVGHLNFQFPGSEGTTEKLMSMFAYDVR